jgi:hypothetical protein
MEPVEPVDPEAVHEAKEELLALARLLAPATDLLTIVREPGGRILPPRHPTGPAPAWRDPARARAIRDALRRRPSPVVAAALGKAAEPARGRRKVIRVAIRLGMPDIVSTLVRLLEEHGSTAIAEDYLNSGNEALSGPAKQWAATHGYVIEQVESDDPARWGAG